MCWEDVQIGRSRVTTHSTVTTAVDTDAVAARSDKWRTLLRFSPPSVGTFFFAPRVMTAINQGLLTTAGHGDIELDIEKYGEIVTQEWHVFSATASAVSVVEVRTQLTRQAALERSPT